MKRPQNSLRLRHSAVLGFFSALGFAFLSSAWAAEPFLKLPPQTCAQAWSALVPKGQHLYRPETDHNYATYRDRVRRATCRKDWTVLVYMAANNNLSPYALADLYEMEGAFTGANAAASTLSTDLVVQVDTARNDGVRRLHMFQSKNEFKVLPKEAFENWTIEKNISSPTVPDANGNLVLPEREFLADGKTPKSEEQRFAEFLAWGMQNYPADHYMVVIWGHGQGWTSSPPRTLGAAPRRVMTPEEIKALVPFTTPAPKTRFSPGNALDGFGGIAYNQSTGEYLGIPSVMRALSYAANLRGKPVDLYVSDACLMQMVEVATQLKNVARYIVGSAQIESFLGLPYRRLMYELNTRHFNGAREDFAGVARQPDEAELLARMIPKIYRQSMNNGLQGRVDPTAIKTLTSSAIDTAGLSNLLLPALYELGDALDAYLAELPFRAIDLQLLIQGTPSYDGSSQDLATFLGLVQRLTAEEAAKNFASTPTSATASGDATAMRGYTPASARLYYATVRAQEALGPESDLSKPPKALIAYALGKDYEALNSDPTKKKIEPRGLAIWLPASPEDFAARIRDFQSSMFYHYAPAGTRNASPSWPRWLTRLYAQ